ncbi:hypothetical protein BH20VER1_BH20VER1_24370 [soil metagenome]
MKHSRVRFIFAGAALLLVVPPFLFGAAWPSYSAVRDYISELGAAGAPHAALVNFSFIAAGAAHVAACVALNRVLPNGRTVWIALLLLSAVGWAYLGAAAAPCDPGCPETGSAQQAVHNLIGLLGYLLGGVGLITLGWSTRRVSVVGPAGILAGLVLLGALTVMAMPEFQEVRGLAQRLGGGTVIAWMLLAAWRGRPL